MSEDQGFEEAKGYVNNRELKKPTTYQEQIQILTSRRLSILNEQSTIEVLKKVNYYRLSAYFLSLKKDGTDEFKLGITFEHVFRLYEFDTKLRNLLMEYLEGIEITFRTHISYVLAHKYGSIGYLDSANFVNKEHHNKFVIEFEREKSRQKELFIKHHIENYNSQLPIWVAVEIMSFGMLSTLFANMKSEDQKDVVAEGKYSVPRDYIQNWLKVLSYVRNVCAHFGRLYNKNLVSKPKLFKEDYRNLNNDKIFSCIFLMKRLIQSRDDWNHFYIKLVALMEEYEEVELQRIGFTNNWINLLRP